MQCITNIITGTCSADTCDGDRTVTCDENLCGGCMDPSYVQTGSTTSSTDCDDGFVDTLHTPNIKP